MKRSGVVMLGVGIHTLAASGSVPVDEAGPQCVARARLAQRPRGSAGIVADNRGKIGATISIGISTDYRQSCDPDQVDAACAFNRSGQDPIFPYFSSPESRI